VIATPGTRQSRRKSVTDPSAGRASVSGAHVTALMVLVHTGTVRPLDQPIIRTRIGVEQQCVVSTAMPVIASI
jgi:hypothetical protein